MAQFRTFEEIEAWKESRIFLHNIRAICARPNVKRDFSFVDQITRSARSISANIAEGNDALTIPEFITCLGISKRSAAEVRSHLHDALDEKYISATEYEKLNALGLKIQRMTAKLIHHLQSLDPAMRRTFKREEQPGTSNKPKNQQTKKHFTATAFIVDSRRRTLLLWHKRLGRWMPPGGHVEADELPDEAAKRECKEETGLDVEIVGDAQDDLFEGNPGEGRMLKKPIAMLLEHIPAYPPRNEPAHEHMDFLFLARPVDEAQVLSLNEDEGREMRWFTKKEIETLDERKEIFSNVKRYVLRVL